MRYIEIDGIKKSVYSCYQCPCGEDNKHGTWCNHPLRHGTLVLKKFGGIAEFCPLREKKEEEE